MGKKDGMYFYYDWIAPMKKIPAKMFKSFVISMLEYHKSGVKPPRFQGSAGLAADFIFPQIDRAKKFAALGSEGGKKSHEKNQNRADAWIDAQTDGQTDGSTHIHKHNTNTDTDTLNRDKNSDPPPSANDDRFERFWRAYPKKVGKGAAMRVFEKVCITDELLSGMLDAVQKQSMTYQWKTENGRFIPNPATWLGEERWKDEVIPDSRPAAGSFDTDDFFNAALRRTYGNPDQQ